MATAQDMMLAVEQVVVQAVGEVICQMQLQRDAAALLEEDEQELPYDDDDDDDNNEKEKDPMDLATINATQAHLLSARALIKTPHVDIFVPQAIFNGGIDRAEKAFKKLLKSSKPVFWSNTNTRPSEYAAALSTAEKAGRPVQFVAWGTHRLPRVSRQELLRRNMSRFRTSGRYIPAGAVSAALGRFESLVNQAQTEAELLFEDDTSYPPEIAPDEWENYMMDVAFASLAGFRMDEGGFVVQVGEPQRL